ncbi:MAG: putative lipopolysaccharide heptosyltransferase III [candidate division NC10 bacterium]|nr:putative lipopolysaccharide heptosyltransferase III [candidate division NC10 bacterium]
MKMLLLAIRAMGDVVLTTPIYRLLKNAYPMGTLDVVVERPYGDLLFGNPNLDAIYEVERSRKGPGFLRWPAHIKLIAALRRRRYDMVVDLFSGPRSAMMARLTGARCRIGEDTRRRGRGFLYTHPVPVKREEEHLVMQKLRLIRSLVGEVAEAPLELFILPREREEAEMLLRSAGARQAALRVGLFPGAGWAHKRWPPECFAALGDILASERAADIFLLGGERDVAACEAVAARMHHSPVLVCERRSLRATAALISMMDLFVSNDTGPMHMAVALQVATVALFGPSNIQKYAPWGNRFEVVSRYLPCSPCPQHQDTCHLVGRVRQECMLEISVEEVLGAIARLTPAATEMRWPAEKTS